MDTHLVEVRAKPVAGQKAERSFQVERAAVNEEARTAELAFSSEAPYERWWGTEILDHSTGACDLSRLKAGGPLLCDHDTRDQVGVIESVRIDADRVGRAVVRFGRSARAEEIFRDVVDGIRRSVSVGYLIDDLVLAEKSGDDETYRVTRWTPFEISLVSVPADFSVGVGRAATPPQEKKVDPIIETQPVDIAKVQAEARSSAREAEVARAREILAIGTQFASRVADAAAMAQAAVAAGQPVEEFRKVLMDKLSTSPLPAPASQIGLSNKETQRYSLTKAIRALVDRDWAQAGYERECSEAIMKRAGVSNAPNGGFYVPYEILSGQRDMTVASPSGGGYLVATDNLAGSFIDLLRNRTVVAQLGATMLSGLVGNVTIPKQTAGATAYWLANEATAITESAQTLGQLALSPKNVGAYTEVSRQLLLQSSPSIDALVMNDLARVLAIAIDSAAISGNGSGAPTGIVNTGSIGGVTGTSIDYAKVLEFQTDVAGSNALAPSCAYLTTPAVAALLLQRVKVSSTYSPLWEGGVLDGSMCGFRAMSSLQVPTANMIFGDFSQVVIGEWGMLEIAMNPYANFAAAITGIRAIQTVDVGIRQAGAFSLATSIT